MELQTLDLPLFVLFTLGTGPGFAAHIVRSRRLVRRQMGLRARTSTRMGHGFRSSEM
jgi:hypothetical protein